MRKELIALMTVATLILVGIALVSPKATVMTNEASTEIYGIDVFGLTNTAKDLPVEQYAAY